MPALETGTDKIQEICDLLRKETLEPAREQASRVLKEAEEEVHRRLQAAEEQAEAILHAARQQIEQEKNVARSFLQQAVKQSLRTLRQDIEEKLFDQTLARLMVQESARPDLVAALIAAIVQAIGREGTSVDLTALIPKTVAPSEVNRQVGQAILDRLREQSVQVAEFAGGAQVKLHDKKLTIDMTDGTLKELLATFLRKDFREMVFSG